eukprot:jgi/Botrbrau1/6579/Bobra.0189s0006.1
MAQTLLIICLFISSLAAISGLTTSGGRIYDGGSELQLKGICWFGFNNDFQMVSDLYAGDDSITKDFRTVAWRMKALGFNAVRLAFNFATLHSGVKGTYQQDCKIASEDEVIASISKSGTSSGTKYSSPPKVEGKCSADVPDDSVYNRFLYVANFMASQGFYVLVDWHNSGKGNQVGDIAFSDATQFGNDWVQLVKDLKAQGSIPGKLMIDLINEPDAYAIRWEPSNGLPGLKDLYLSILPRLYEVAPDALFFIEGTGQSMNKANWGDGFNTDQLTIAQWGISDPTAFLDALVKQDYINQVVLSPHVYCPSTSGAPDGYAGTELDYRLDQSFGQKGAFGWNGHIFPIVIGEFSVNFRSANPTAERDCWNSIVQYMNSGTDGHPPITTWFFWGWNANSVDTGGITTNNDPKKVDWEKLDALRSIGLSPWYA